MPLTTFDFKPGLFSDDTAALSEQNYVDGSNVRFVRGRPEIIGGWELLSASTFLAPIRGAHAWAALSGDRAIAFGSAKELKAYFGGAMLDITPKKSRGTLTNPFTTVSGSKVVTVRDLDHGLKTGDIVTFTHAAAVGGLTLNGAFPIAVVTNDSYTIQAATNATGSVANGGSYVDFEVPMDDGLISGVGGTGFGTGGYGLGAWGLPTGGDIDPAVWSLANWGSDLLALRNNGALYSWQPLPSYDEVIQNPSFETTANWVAPTGWGIAGGQATASGSSAADMTQDVSGRLRGGLVYVMEVDLGTVAAGELSFHVQRADVDDANAPIVEMVGTPVAATGTYRRFFYAPPNPTKVILRKSATFAGTVRSFSIKPASEAFRVPGAPQYSRGMFVDANRIAVVYGTVESDGDYNPMCVRWSDIERNNVWLADEDNIAGEYILGSGSKIIGAIPGRGQNIIFTDTAVYTMRFNQTGFTFDQVGTGGGLIGKNAVAEHQGLVFSMGRDGQFRIFRGGENQIITCPVRDEVWSNLAFSQGEKVFAGINSERSEVWFSYPDKRDGTNECSREVVYNWAEDTWFFAKKGRSAWVPAGVYQNPIGCDPVSLRAFFEERGVTANGDPIEWHLKTGRFNVGEGENLFGIGRFVPDFSNQEGNVKVTFDMFAFPRGPLYTTQTVEVTPETPSIALRRQLGRVLQITFSNGVNSRSARWGLPGLDVIPTKARR